MHVPLFCPPVLILGSEDKRWKIHVDVKVMYVYKLQHNTLGDGNLTHLD